MDPLEYLTQTSLESRVVQDTFLREHANTLVLAAQAIGKSLQNGGKVLILGNGGSAADAQHMAAEMVGKMMIDRRPLPAIALTTDSSNITAIGNDFGYDQIFVRQIQALSRPGDIVLAFSTSGKSSNVIQAIHVARDLGCVVIGLTGGSGGKMKGLCDIFLNASQGQNSSRIQETHIFAIHSLVDLLDRYYLETSIESSFHTNRPERALESTEQV